jgi:hypothetical protein
MPRDSWESRDVWRVERIVNFPPSELFAGSFTEDGFTLLGLHAPDGSLLVLGPKRNWIGCLQPGKLKLSWSVGPRTKTSGPEHISADLDNPSWIEDYGNGSYLITDAGHHRICLLEPSRRCISTFIDLRPLGLRSPANCILDSRGYLWINDPSMAMLWVFSRSGELIRALGDADASRRPRAEVGLPPGNARPAVQKRSLEDMDLGEVYDIRRGNDGLIYILEGSLYRLRVVDFQRNTVSIVAGCGARGFSGDGGDPRAATFGGAPSRRPDGPWAFCIGDDNAIYIADTWNGAVRMIDPERGRIATIAGGRLTPAGRRNDPAETDPLGLILPSICWMDWGDGMLFVADRTGELAVIAPT